MTNRNIENKPEIAIFDIDGTLLPGITIMDFPEFLAHKNLFNKSSLAAIKTAMSKYHDGKTDYNIFIDRVVEEYAKGLKGEMVDIIQVEANSYWKSKLESVYLFLKPFLEKLHARGGKAIVLSGSENNSLKPFLEAFDFDEINTTQIGITNEKYSGTVIFNAANLNNKRKKVAEILAKYPKKKFFYYGFGDSEADYAFLEHVDQPVVTGQQDKILQKYIKENKHWLNISDPENIEDLKF